MDYATNYDVGDRKRGTGINEDGVGLVVFEQGHRDGVRGADRAAGDDGAGGGDDGDGRPAPANRGAAAFALADGAGGHEAGDTAAYLAATTVCRRLARVAVDAAASDPSPFDLDAGGALPDRPSAGEVQTAVEEAVVAAHRTVLEHARDSGEAAYTTVVAGVVAGGDLHYGWVGDSRAYVVNGARRRADLLTKDHSVVERLRDAGEIDDVEALVHPRGNEITRALGGAGDADPATATVEVATNTVPLYAEDVVLVTSDGLVDAQTDAPALYDRYVESGRSEAAADLVRERAVTDDEIRDLVLAADSLSGAAADLVAMANDRGGKDNLSTLLLRDRQCPDTPEALPVRAVDPDEPIEERETVIVEE